MIERCATIKTQRRKQLHEPSEPVEMGDKVSLVKKHVQKTKRTYTMASAISEPRTSDYISRVIDCELEIISKAHLKDPIPIPPTV